MVSDWPTDQQLTINWFKAVLPGNAGIAGIAQLQYQSFIVSGRKMLESTVVQTAVLQSLSTLPMMARTR